MYELMVHFTKGGVGAKLMSFFKMYFKSLFVNFSAHPLIFECKFSKIFDTNNNFIIEI